MSDVQTGPAPLASLHRESTVIVGTRWRGAEALQSITRLRPGDEIVLRRANHPQDAYAIETWWENQWLGYIPRAANVRIAPAIASGLMVSAVVAEPGVIRGSWVQTEPKITVIWPVDEAAP